MIQEYAKENVQPLRHERHLWMRNIHWLKDEIY